MLNKMTFIILVIGCLIVWCSCSEDVSEGGPLIQVTISEEPLRTNRTIYFGEVVVGQHSQARKIEIKNIGESDLLISDFILDLHTDFSVSFSDNVLPLELKTGEIKEIEIHFRPSMKGSFNSTLFIKNNSVNYSDYTISLQGKGI